MKNHYAIILFFAIILIIGVAVHAEEKIKPPSLTVTGQGESRAPLSLADIILNVEVRSYQFGTDEFQDIEPFGDNVPKLPTKKDRNHEFYFTQDNSSSSVFCTTCVHKEVVRRSTSLLNYIRWLNSTDLSSFSLATENVNINIQSNPLGNGFTNLKTASITTRPEHKWSNNENKLIGYVGSASIHVRVPTEYSHLLLNKALDVGATQIHNVQLVAKDEDIALHQRLADAKAAEVAFDRAINVLSALNLKLSKIQSVNVGSGQSYQPRPPVMESMMMARADAMATPKAFGGSAVGDNSILVGEDVPINGTVTLEIQFT